MPVLFSGLIALVFLMVPATSQAHELLPKELLEISFFHNAWDFIRLGITHVFGGTDHVLFVISLVLVFISLKHILKLISAFTVAHSLTLILAGTQVLTLSSRIVEPIIALSIAYIALTSVFLKHRPFFASTHNKIGVVFFFGLFHGLGFAGLLQGLGIPDGKFVSSLVSFNIGIEIGQLIILAAALPLIYFFRQKIWYPTAIKTAAIVISTFGIVWAVQRLMS